MSQIDRTQLADALYAYFSLGELRTLAFDLEIPYEDLAGRGKRTKVLSLVEYAERHGRFDEIVHYVSTTRPNLDWNAAEGTPAADSPSRPTSSNVEYHFYEKVIGSAIGEGSRVRAENIAGHDIVIGAVPEDKETFMQQLDALEKLLQDAIEAGEIADRRDAQTAVEDLQDVREEAAHPEPRRGRLTRRLEDVGETLAAAAQLAKSAGKTGAAVLKALPIVSALTEAAQDLF